MQICLEMITRRCDIPAAELVANIADPLDAAVELEDTS